MIDRITASQLGLATRAQLLEAGLSRQMVDRRVRTKRLRVRHRGVYAWGPIVPAGARELAAALACGPRAAVSHDSAGALLRLVAPEAESAPVHMSGQDLDCARRPGIRWHRVPPFHADEILDLNGIPVTSPTRTIIDLAARLDGRPLEQVLATAERLQLTTPDLLLAHLERAPRRRGARRLRKLLDDRNAAAFTRSEAEERFLAMVRRADMPAPQVNAMCAGHEVDFLWRGQKLVVEIDGFAYHSSQRSFEADRRRDARLAARGYRVIRVTWQQLRKKPEATLVSVAQALALATS